MTRKRNSPTWIALAAGAWLALGAVAVRAQDEGTSPLEQPLPPPVDMVHDDGYTWRREQTWTNPDGTPLRQHEMTVTGTDPYNFQRDKTIALRDGRTVEHHYTQSWDGTTLQRERTFLGPNGQWLQKLNPFARKQTSDGQTMSRPRSVRPSGFTLGSSARGGKTDGRDLTQRQAAAAETGTRRQIQQHLQQVEERRAVRLNLPRPHPRMR